MRLTLFITAALVMCTSVARADRLVASEEEARTSAGVAAPGDAGRGVGVGTGGASGMTRPLPGPPPPVPALTNANVREALERARPEMQACVDAAGLRGGTVRARISRDAALRITARTRPRQADAELCVDTAARRHLTPLLSRMVRRAVSANIRLGGAGPIDPPPDGPRPPPSADVRELHDRLDAAQGMLRRCLDEAFPGMTGTVTLNVVAHRDGSMVLEGAGLPPGVPAGPMLVCLGNEVAHLRVSAGGERSVSHDLVLGR